MSVDLTGKIAIVTGAGAGLGRAEAVALARAGARVVLNDLPGAAEEAAEEIRGFGGEAVIAPGDVSERATADAMMAAAVDGLGGLDIVVNNAGITRDKMLFNMSDEEFDLVVRVHLRGHFLLTRNASAHWRSVAKSTGAPVAAAVVNTSSEAFLSGPPGQANYGAAKAGITALTMSTARSMGRSGVRANAICPRAATAMTEGVLSGDSYGPEHVAPLVTYLASPAAAAITGQVFVVYGGMIAVLAPPTVAERFDNAAWDLDSLDKQVGGWFVDRDPAAGFSADSIMQLKLKEQ
ncbi:SDR family NAD(P)-dependent oxidoreductase [Nocardioides sp. NPDC000445]|uniref:SDR family oxidoreductase n=1 Tax=Nocardioides sp. NPDC000445 TaxID=3154257 RepID=UPI0033339383